MWTLKQRPACRACKHCSWHNFFPFWYEEQHVFWWKRGQYLLSLWTDFVFLAFLGSSSHQANIWCEIQMQASFIFSSFSFFSWNLVPQLHHSTNQLLRVLFSSRIVDVCFSNIANQIDKRTTTIELCLKASNKIPGWDNSDNFPQKQSQKFLTHKLRLDKSSWERWNVEIYQSLHSVHFVCNTKQHKFASALSHESHARSESFWNVTFFSHQLGGAQAWRREFECVGSKHLVHMSLYQMVDKTVKGGKE